MTNLYLLSRKIHRLLVLMIFVSGAIMAITGIMLKFQLGDLAKVGYLHNQMSLIFAVILFLMAISGLIMYLYPILKQKNA